jgi:hypothetical protein
MCSRYPAAKTTFSPRAIRTDDSAALERFPPVQQSSESQRQIILEEAQRILASPEFVTTPRLG